MTAIRFPLKVESLLQMDISGVDQLFKSATPPLKWPLRANVILFCILLTLFIIITLFSMLLIKSTAGM